MRIASALLCVSIALASCAPVQTRQQVLTPINSNSTASIGDSVLRIQKTENLPNAFGNADIFGRTRPAGWIDVRLVAVDSLGAVFRRIDTEVQSNETTMSRTPMAISTYSGTATKRTVTGTGVTVGPAPGSTEILPPNAVEFRLAPGQEITVSGHRLRLISIAANSVQYGVGR